MESGKRTQQNTPYHLLSKNVSEFIRKMLPMFGGFCAADPVTELVEQLKRAGKDCQTSSRALIYTSATRAPEGRSSRSPPSLTSSEFPGLPPVTLCEGPIRCICALAVNLNGLTWIDILFNNSGVSEWLPWTTPSLMDRRRGRK